MHIKQTLLPFDLCVLQFNIELLITLKCRKVKLFMLISCKTAMIILVSISLTKYFDEIDEYDTAAGHRHR